MFNCKLLKGKILGYAQNYELGKGIIHKYYVLLDDSNKIIVTRNEFRYSNDYFMTYEEVIVSRKPSLFGYKYTLLPRYVNKNSNKKR